MLDHVPLITASCVLFSHIGFGVQSWVPVFLSSRPFSLAGLATPTPFLVHWGGHLRIHLLVRRRQAPWVWANIQAGKERMCLAQSLGLCLLVGWAPSCCAEPVGLFFRPHPPCFPPAFLECGVYQQLVSCRLFVAFERAEVVLLLVAALFAAPPGVRSSAPGFHAAAHQLAEVQVHEWL